MQGIYIGKVIAVSNLNISIAIDSHLEAPYTIIDSDAIRIAGVGNYVRVENNVYEITEERIELASDHKETETSIQLNRIVIAKVAGYYKGESFFQGSSGDTPNVFDNVYTVTNDELQGIYSGTISENYISVGNFLYRKELEFHIDINKFFASHTLIVGNTGSGKSNTVNTIYTQLFSKFDVNNSKFLIIDTNGEYRDAFCTTKSVKSLDTRNVTQNTIKIPLEVLTNEDWKLLLEATDKTQYPIIKTTWNGIKRTIFDNVAVTSMNIGTYIWEELRKCILSILYSTQPATNKLGSINSLHEDLLSISDPYYATVLPVFGCFNNIIVNGNKFTFTGDVYTDVTLSIVAQIYGFSGVGSKGELTVEDFGVLLNFVHVSRIFKYNTPETNTAPLIQRFRSNKQDFIAIFTSYHPGDRGNILESLFGDNNILVCDVSMAKKDIRRIVVTFLCSKMYAQAIAERDSEKSYHLIVDEAHNYLSAQNMDKEDAIAKTCIETFEQIIKEGRKYGVFLTMSTQRPSDITPTLLSQAHNYVIHKLVNPKDIEIMKNTVPFIDATSISMLTVLAPGQAIFTGTAFTRPNTVQMTFDESITKVNSETIKLMNIWSGQHREEDERDEDEVPFA